MDIFWWGMTSLINQTPTRRLLEVLEEDYLMIFLNIFASLAGSGRRGLRWAVIERISELCTLMPLAVAFWSSFLVQPVKCECSLP